jgi:hypothetical protein
MIARALHLSIFEQPVEKDFFNTPINNCSGTQADSPTA